MEQQLCETEVGEQGSCESIHLILGKSALN